MAYFAARILLAEIAWRCVQTLLEILAIKGSSETLLNSINRSFADRLS